jgi:hypothetical protein
VCGGSCAESVRFRWPRRVDRAAYVVELASRGSGSVLVLPTPDSAGVEGLRSAFKELRLDEFTGDCGGFEEEIAKETRNGKFTLAELEEEEQRLDRLRGYRDLKSRDVLELPEAQAAEERLRECTTVFEGYADRVFATLHAPAGHDLPGNREIGNRE